MKKRILTGLIVGGSIGVIAAVVTFLRLSPLEGLELYTHDLRAQAAADPRRADPRIVLVDVAERDIRWVQRAVGAGWPWPREIFRITAAQLLAAGAAAVTFDFLFLDPGNAGIEDVQAFGEVLAASPATVIGLKMLKWPKKKVAPGPYGVRLGRFAACKEARALAHKLLFWQTRAYVVPRGQKGGCVLWIGGEETHRAMARELKRLRGAAVIPEKRAAAATVQKLAKPVRDHEITRARIARRRAGMDLKLPPDVAFARYRGILAPLIPLMLGARLGVVGQKQDSDGLYRRYAPLAVHGGQAFPSLSLATAMAAHPEKKVRFKGRDLYFGDAPIRLDGQGRVVVRLHGSGRIYPRVGIRHILSVKAQQMAAQAYAQDKKNLLAVLFKKPFHPQKAGGALDGLAGLDHPPRCRQKLGPLLAAVRKRAAGLNAPRAGSAQREKSTKSAKPATPATPAKPEKTAQTATTAPPVGPVLESLRAHLNAKVCRPVIDDVFRKHLRAADKRYPARFAGRKDIRPGSPQNRIFIIHADAAALRDIKPTPLDPKARGAETIAAFLDNLLHGEFVRRCGRWSAAALAFLLCVLLGLGTFLLVGVIRSAVWAAASSLLVATAVIGVYAVVAFALFESSGIWLDMAAPALGVVVTWAVAVGAHIYQEGQNRRFVQDALGRYTSPALVKELIRNPHALSLEWGETRPLTVFFSDVVSFTSISERLEPQQLVALLNEYLTAMTDIILEKQGVVDKYIGDAIMAFWGAPVPDAQHAAHACQAALAANRRLGELQEVWKKRFGETVDFRAGVNSGEAVVGNMGSLHKYNYTVMGDTVNLASRLEGANKVYGTRLMIAEGTRRLIGEAFVCRELDLLTVKGKEKPVKVYELVGERSVVDEETVKMVDRFDAALRKYREREFAAAQESFQAIVADFPQDGPAALYAQRCTDYVKQPPPADWDGVFRMKTK
jgi:class 3 adenylate cyclase